MRILLFLLAFFCFLISTTAQDSLIVEKLKPHVYAFTYHSGKLEGEGFDFMLQMAEKVPFFLIGEDHGIAEIPLFTAALFKQFNSKGYQFFATETGPFTAEFLEKSVRDKDWKTDYTDFLKKYPWSIPFYSWKEECSILDALAETTNTDQPRLWGLDQEFAGGYRMNFKYLLEHAQNDKSKEVATEYLNKAMAAYVEAFEGGNPQKSFLLTVNEADFQNLKTAFKGQKKNLELIKELEESTQIYQFWYQGKGYESNRLRAQMMKRHFWNYYSKAEQKSSEPKVMFKFGANHIYRGPNGLNVFDIGNFVSELANLMGKESFHLYAIGKKGTQNAFTPFSQSEADKQKAYDASKYLDKINFTPIFDLCSDDTWAIIDLRPLRPLLFSRKIKNVQSGLEKLIWSYDAVLVIPEVSASINFD